MLCTSIFTITRCSIIMFLLSNENCRANAAKPDKPGKATTTTPPTMLPDIPDNEFVTTAENFDDMIPGSTNVITTTFPPSPTMLPDIPDNEFVTTAENFDDMIPGSTNVITTTFPPPPTMLPDIPDNEFVTTAENFDDMIPGSTNVITTTFPPPPTMLPDIPDNEFVTTAENFDDMIPGSTNVITTTFPPPPTMLPDIPDNEFVTTAENFDDMIPGSTNVITTTFPPPPTMLPDIPDNEFVTTAENIDDMIPGSTNVITTTFPPPPTMLPDIPDNEFVTTAENFDDMIPGSTNVIATTFPPPPTMLPDIPDNEFVTTAENFDDMIPGSTNVITTTFQPPPTMLPDIPDNEFVTTAENIDDMIPGSTNVITTTFPPPPTMLPDIPDNEFVTTAENFDDMIPGSTNVITTFPPSPNMLPDIPDDEFKTTTENGINDNTTPGIMLNMTFQSTSSANSTTNTTTHYIAHLTSDSISLNLSSTSPTSVSSTAGPKDGLMHHQLNSLLDSVLLGYDPRLRPRKNQRRFVTIFSDFVAQSIIEFNTQYQRFIVMGYFKMDWRDDFLKWDKSAYGNTSLLRIPIKSIWTPKLIVDKAYDGERLVGDRDTDIALINYRGYVRWFPEGLYSVVCPVTIRFYPYDTQTCTFTYFIGDEDNSTINLKHDGDVDLSEYIENAEWKLVSLTAQRKQIDNVHVVQFHFNVERRGGFAMFTLIVPVLMLSTLSGMTFLIPIESGEKCGFSVTIFLAYGIFETVVIDTLPHNSLDVSYFIIYLTSLVIVSIALTFYTILQAKLFDKFGNKELRIMRCKDNAITWASFLKRLDIYFFVLFLVVVIGCTSTFLGVMVKKFDFL